MRQYQKLIAIIILVFVIVTGLGIDFAQAQELSLQANNQNDAGSTNDTLTILGVVLVVGLTAKLIDSLRDKKAYQTHLEKGQQYLSDQKYALAVTELETARDNKDTKQVRSLLQQAYIGKGQSNLESQNYNLALSNFKQAQRLKNSQEVQELLQQAQEKYQQQHYQLALDYKEQGQLTAAYQEFEKVQRYGNYLDTNQLAEQVYQKLKQLKLKRLAVLDFEDTTYGYGNLGSKVASLFTGELLAKNPKFIEIIEREQLNSIVSEQKLSDASGLVDASTAQELGNILGVDYIVVAKILSADVDTDISSEYQEEYDASEGEYVDKKIYTKKREAYTQIIFKLLDVSNAKVVTSRTIKKTAIDSESYESGGDPDLISENKLFDEVLTEAVSDFADVIYQKYEI
ncbi:CsgG/HfaB family protein [Halanaerobacter jeridensis]|uniref:Tfp pilus assembly protein PilF n=1 Tax=Halanaerobacter jeridensis TaxID=706427 RepID=A0A938XTN3_9FIRM|nr:CsgG/HfaB family protein [Halanaerobacter jeridensis]MBM7557536.1 Tfp pilus assembly protein PilF [Halanaerobacter jeridensis]